MLSKACLVELLEYFPYASLEIHFCLFPQSIFCTSFRAKWKATPLSVISWHTEEICQLTTDWQASICQCRLHCTNQTLHLLTYEVSQQNNERWYSNRCTFFSLPSHNHLLLPLRVATSINSKITATVIRIWTSSFWMPQKYACTADWWRHKRHNLKKDC